MWPQEYGAAKSPLFFLTLNFWFPKTFQRHRRVKVIPSNIPELELPESQNIDPNVELIPQAFHDRAKIKFSGLAKRYGDGKVAVKNLAVAMLEGQITCLLGHNGAGCALIIYPLPIKLL